MIKPIFTEKSLTLAGEGKYTFKVDRGMTKKDIRNEIARIFGVHVVRVRTLSVGGETGRNIRGRKFTKLGIKKAIVTLQDKEKLDIFEESKK